MSKYTSKNNRLVFCASIIALVLSLSIIGSAQTAAVQADGAATDIDSQSLSLPPVELTPSEEAEIDTMVLPVPINWIGDFDGMTDRHLVRILVPHSKTYFYIDRGRQQGVDYEFGKALEEWLNKNHPIKIKNQSWRVFFIPVRRDQLLPDLLAGKGDMAGGGLNRRRPGLGLPQRKSKAAVGSGRLYESAQGRNNLRQCHGESLRQERKTHSQCDLGGGNA